MTRCLKIVSIEYFAQPGLWHESTLTSHPIRSPLNFSKSTLETSM